MRLFDFAFVPNYPEPLERLKQLSENEYWGRGGRMLKSYFNHMFDKVIDDGLIYYSLNRECAIFNTGLQTERMEPLFAVFVKNERDDAQEWFLRGFSTENNTGLGELLSEFDELPERARFLTRCEQAFYELKVGPPDCDWASLILNNVSRIPRFLISEATEERIELPDLREVGKDVFMERLDGVAALLAEDSGLQTLCVEMEEALEKTMDQLALDYKIAVPTWHAKDKCLALTLPLRVRTKDPNIVLAVRWEEKANTYQPINLLTPEMAYNNARLVSRPEAAWLLKSKSTRS